MRTLASLGLCLLVGSGLGCDHHDRAEAARVMYALDQLRKAPNESKAPLVDALASVPCSRPINCAARDRCADAYRHLVQGVQMEQSVRQRIGQLESTVPRDTNQIQQLTVDLDKADLEIDRAKQAVPECEQAASVVRRTFGI